MKAHFVFNFIKISFPVHFLLKWRQNLSARPRTVENSWWWAKELPETCRFSWQNKFGKISAPVGFI